MYEFAKTADHLDNRTCYVAAYNDAETAGICFRIQLPDGYPAAPATVTPVKSDGIDEAAAVELLGKATQFCADTAAHGDIVLFYLVDFLHVELNDLQ
jgi:hypothetical protein